MGSHRSLRQGESSGEILKVESILGGWTMVSGLLALASSFAKDCFVETVPKVSMSPHIKVTITTPTSPIFPPKNF